MTLLLKYKADLVSQPNIKKELADATDSRYL